MFWQEFLNILGWVFGIIIILGLLLYYLRTETPIPGSFSPPQCETSETASTSMSSENVLKAKTRSSTETSVKKRKAESSSKTPKAFQPSNGPTPAGNSLPVQTTSIILVPSSVTVVSSEAGSALSTNTLRRIATRSSANHVDSIRVIARPVHEQSTCPVVTGAHIATTQRTALEEARVENFRLLASTITMPSVATERSNEELGHRATPVTSRSSPVAISASTSSVTGTGRGVAGVTPGKTGLRFVDVPTPPLNVKLKLERVSETTPVQTPISYVATSTSNASKSDACLRSTIAPWGNLATTSLTTPGVDRMRDLVLNNHIHPVIPSLPPSPPPTPPSLSSSSSSSSFPSNSSSLSSTPSSTPAPPRLSRAPRTKLFEEYERNSEPEDKKLDLRGQYLIPAMQMFTEFYTDMEHMYTHDGYKEEDRYIYVVTGYGKLNEGRPPVIKPAVQSFLNDHEIRHNWLNDGLVMIDFCEEEDEEMEPCPEPTDKDLSRESK